MAHIVVQVIPSNMGYILAVQRRVDSVMLYNMRKPLNHLLTSVQPLMFAIVVSLDPRNASPLAMS